MTDAFQPLAWRFLDVLQGYAKRLFIQSFWLPPRATRIKAEATQDLIIAWANLASTMIEEVWDVYLSRSEKKQPAHSLQFLERVHLGGRTFGSSVFGMRFISNLRTLA
jgi:hypothetical protein